MIISEIGIKGFKSFGNNEQVFKLDTDSGKLILLAGHNGSGKSVVDKTEISVKFPIENLNIDELTIFLEVMEEEIKSNIFKIDLKKLNILNNKISIIEKGIEVDTPNGWKNIKEIGITSPDSEKIVLKTNNFELSGSPSHRVKYLENWFFLKDLKVGNSINTKNGIEKIISISTDSKKEDLWDIEVDGHEYYTNGILSHNSSFLTCFEYSLYGKVRGGKTKKWATLSSIPNRINGETLNYIKFKSNNTDVMVKRGIGPNVLELWENDIENTRAGKSNIDTKIEEYIGMDLETFKSFISMSISDFKNFISLSNEEKKMLLDKLFNLEVINTLSSISKDLNKVNKSTLTILDSDISTLEDSINSIQTSIEKTLSKQKEQKEQGLKEEIESLKEIINSKKEEFLSLKTKIEKITDKRTEINSDIEKEKEEYYKIKSSVSKITEEIKLYDSGKCPTCKTDFTSDHFMTLRSTLVEKLDSVNKIKETIESNSKELKEKKTKLDDLFTKTNESFGSLKFLLSSTKEKIAKLTVRLENSDTESDKTGIEEFEKSISELEERIKQNKDKKNVCSEKELIYKELNNIFGESGVKKSIISNIIKPINKYISENVKQMGIPFSVELDNTFSADIKHLGVVIDPETLSMGETRRINIAIIVAYLKLIRTKKHINILFLDEVFASIDLDGIESILSLLKTFAEEYKINIFVVHHAILNEEVFDRIFKVNKNVFTTIEEIKTIQ